MDPNTKILIIEDDKPTLNLIQRQLIQMGFRNFYTAQDGGAAILKLNSGGFQLIIADWHMPFMDGLELLKDIRSSKKYGDIPFIMVTAETRTEHIREALRAGVNGYIIKPFSAATLEGKIREVLEPDSSLPSSS